MSDARVGRILIEEVGEGKTLSPGFYFKLIGEDAPDETPDESWTGPYETQEQAENIATEVVIGLLSTMINKGIGL